MFKEISSIIPTAFKGSLKNHDNLTINGEFDGDEAQQHRINVLIHLRYVPERGDKVLDVHPQQLLE
ncbi:MAG: hypothetical protein COY75_08045 [Nitrospirae bacterium CG_4_10_14_0_8_um_filter_41_23]|nr:hypothetical protein [Nitrospirota bacterium]OIP59705.1 MAG: hypothetical protein AUK38_04910 [Nitrospirae bacterium CG2_30_41_42]PIQ94248.1 MAG: hypothetical protein COV68_05635 [Nitrospirae bacterium CG11_big_fil_rev_8_21_14_0_20_41_14]PIV43865.1 MAG: hypothetical protein COS27_03820 [Nitrospirae bacterium CG02_land_8_20_14_3_00_41_53]PIW88291.1 MAG: hypothetical protein COZ94_00500 [Nitrospirae bacterium CG_4_8_14_3_um_filter_41_47]PIY86450.1 MAG: hypothetical protein COY75_08045 [Nitros